MAEPLTVGPPELRRETSALVQTGKGSISGRVWFAAATGAFPDEQWSDFVVVLAGWWLQAVSDLWASGGAELLFMDGPVRIQATRLRSGLVELLGIEDRVPRRELPLGVLRIDVLGAEVRSFADEVLEACDAQGLESRDVEELRQRLRLRADRVIG